MTTAYLAVIRADRGPAAVPHSPLNRAITAAGLARHHWRALHDEKYPPTPTDLRRQEHDRARATDFYDHSV